MTLLSQMLFKNHSCAISLDNISIFAQPKCQLVQLQLGVCEKLKQPTETGRTVFKILVWFWFGLVSVSHFLKSKNSVSVLVASIHAPNQLKPNRNKHIIYIIFYIYMGLANVLSKLGSGIWTWPCQNYSSPLPIR